MWQCKRGSKTFSHQFCVIFVSVFPIQRLGGRPCGRWGGLMCIKSYRGECSFNVLVIKKIKKKSANVNMVYCFFSHTNLLLTLFYNCSSLKSTTLPHIMKIKTHLRFGILHHPGQRKNCTTGICCCFDTPSTETSSLTYLPTIKWNFLLILLFCIPVKTKGKSYLCRGLTVVSFSPGFIQPPIRVLFYSKALCHPHQTVIS